MLVPLQIPGRNKIATLALDSGSPLQSGAAMWPIALACLYLAIVVLALWRAVWQLRWYQTVTRNPSRIGLGSPSVAIIVPARNEADHIADCLEGLLGQDYPWDRLTLTVVDDGSTDGTRQCIRRLAGVDRRLRSIEVDELPSGWTGKSYACWRGALAASKDGSEWLCFIDADTRAAPALIGSAVDIARRDRLDMLSLEPFQELTTFLDRLVIPVGLFAIAVTRDLRRTNRGRHPEASVSGQFILIRTAAYFAVGSHFAARGEICEDSALARLVKHAGFSLAVRGAERLIRTRMYSRASEVWEGLSKNVTETLGGSARSLAVAAAGVVVGWASLLLPVAIGLDAAVQPEPARYLALFVVSLTSIAVYAMQIALARHFHIPGWYGLLFPLSCSIAALIVVNAALARYRGRIAWKGRTYAAPAIGRTGLDLPGS